MASGTLQSLVQRLIDEGKTQEARQILLARGYTEALDGEAQDLYLSTFPRPEPPEAAVADWLEGVSSGTSAERAKAARKLNQFARGNWTEHRGRWLTDPRVIGDLLTALDTADDKTAVDVIGALGALSQRYNVSDLRIRGRLVAAFEGASDAVRLAIVQAIPQFGGQDVWEMVARGIDCRPAKSAHFTVGLAVARFGESAGEAERERLARALEAACAKQTKLDALGSLVRGLRVVGDSRSVKTLEEVKERVESRVFKETVADAIQACRGRG